jgi:hypothetical protein
MKYLFYCLLIVGVVFIVFLVTKKKTVLDPCDSSYDNPTYVGELLNRIENGDTVAYLEALRSLQYRWPEDSFLWYSLRMANRYNYPRAYFHSYIHLANPYKGEELDDKTKCLAMYYLLKSYELGYLDRKHLQEYLKNDSIPKASSFLIEMAKIQ